jgi:hypothetical protein
MRSEVEKKIIERAKVEHDRTCRCDPKYLMSCPRMARAILEVGVGDKG